MTITFFNNVLTTLGKRVNYDAVVNYAGNSFAKDAWKTIQESNPLIKHKKSRGFDDMFSEVSIPQAKIVPSGISKQQEWSENKEENVGDVTDSAKDMFAALSLAVNKS